MEEWVGKGGREREVEIGKSEWLRQEGKKMKQGRKEERDWSEHKDEWKEGEEGDIGKDDE